MRDAGTDGRSDGRAEDRRPHYRLPVAALSAFMALEAGLLAWLLWRDPVEMAIWKRSRAPGAAGIPMAPHRLTGLGSNDPPLGAPPPAARSALSRLYPGTQRDCLLIAYAGDCAGCMALDLRRLQSDAAAHHLRAAIFATAARSGIAEFERSAGIDIPALTDAHGTIVKALNAAWAGRMYLFAPDGRLMWREPDEGPTYWPFRDPAFMARLLPRER